MKCFRFKEPGHTYYCKNPGKMEFMKVIAKIKKHLARNPQENSLIFYCLAGHGIVEAGEQKLLVNEYDTKTFFYKMVNPEADIRSMATDYPNSY